MNTPSDAGRRFRHEDARTHALVAGNCGQVRFSGTVQAPVPVRLTFCGLPPLSSLTDTLAVRFPLAEGVNVTVMKQPAPAATLDRQVFVSAKSL